LLVCTTLVALLGAPALTEARRARAAPRIGTVQLSRLPDEAQRTVELVLRGGPFPYRRDGVVFENRERRLPSRPRGYYLEYTVPTPGRRDRGPRRIVFGRGKELYYSDDHYRSFRRVEESP
jgi:ribonuclease T1